MARGSHRWVAVIRTSVVSVVLLVAFGALFASADALFADWIGMIVPSVPLHDVPARAVLGTVVAGITLAAAYVALAPPAVDAARRLGRRSTSRFEWLVPLVVVDAVMAVFLVAQATALFGGHAYLRRTTGLTYAEYVHQGFGELTVATLLTLSVLGWVGRTAAPGRHRDVAAGALGVMTLVVVTSALHRMSLYMDAYGFTRLRLLVSVFEGWLGVVVALVLVGGLLRATWVARVAIRVGAAALLALALANPDAWIAEHNLTRDTSTTPIDYGYLGTLSSDAYPVIARLPQAEFVCVTSASVERIDDEGWLGWNLGRHRAADLEDRRPPAADGAPCVRPSGP